MTRLLPGQWLTFAEIIDDDEIDAVFITLNSGAQLEWAMRALANRKHVMVDTPAVGRVSDAERLLKSPMLHNFNARIFLESSPYRFHPSWREFMNVLDRNKIVHVKVTVTHPTAFSNHKDLKFRHEQSGGAALGPTYAMSVLRAIMGADPTSCARCEIEPGGAPMPKAAP